MIRRQPLFPTLLVLGLLGALLAPPARAHLMPAQQGTLNIVDNAVFMVLSLPVSAFSGQGVDEDGNGRLTPDELDEHKARIIDAIRGQVTLQTSLGPTAPTGIMISPGTDHQAGDSSIDQLIVLGRFNVDDADGAMAFRVGLYGTAAGEQVLKISARRKRDKLHREFELTPQTPVGLVSFPHYTL